MKKQKPAQKTSKKHPAKPVKKTLKTADALLILEYARRNQS